MLLVDPVYRDTWLLPGGGVETDESPYAACQREVAEEPRLAGFEFVPPALVAERVAPVVGRRIAACLEALRSGTVASLENGSPVG